MKHQIKVMPQRGVQLNRKNILISFRRFTEVNTAIQRSSMTVWFNKFADFRESLSNAWLLLH
jgi:hypothetical protein